MSRTNPTEVEALVLELDCYCPARAGTGEWCKTRTGNWATWLHSYRTWPIHQAMGIAYQEVEAQHLSDLKKRRERLAEVLAALDLDPAANVQLSAVLDGRWMW